MKNITWYFQGSMRKTRTLSGNYLKHHSIERLIRMLVPEYYLQIPWLRFDVVVSSEWAMSKVAMQRDWAKLIEFHQFLQGCCW